LRTSLRLCIFAVKEFPSIFHIDRDLALQRFDVGILLLVAEFVQEIDPQMRTINIARKVEQVHFQAGPRIARSDSPNSPAWDRHGVMF